MFDAYVAHHARLRPTAPAIVTAAGATSFATFDAEITRTAILLRTLAGGTDRPVAVEIENVRLNWLVTLALARLGLPSAPGADRDCPLRISDRAAADPTLLIGEREIAAILSGPVPMLARPARAPEDCGRILLSSGTTGQEKRIALSWRMIDASIRNVPVTYGAMPGPWLTATGNHTILGFVLALGCWGLGEALLMPDRPLDGAQLRALRPRLVAMTPGQLDHLLDDLPADMPRQSVRVVTGGGPMPPRLLARTRRALTEDLMSVYGASECGAVAVATPALCDRVPWAAGVVLPGVTVEIVDESGDAVAVGALGHVRIRSDRTANAYLRGEADAFREGWFWPGDLGRLDTQGVLCLEGRADDLMNLGGQKVLPAWIEAAALTAPGVREAAAFSLIDDDGWERCWLAFAVEDGFEEQALGEALRPQLAAAERISWLHVDRLPRNAMGKIERNRLRDLARTITD
ncbi:fatty acid--CoA ligase family protein [Sphingomonas sp. BIUV-7]|uniref:Fatty acid--CoA ligase family protein n=1 Tax=Sphingomonas natans TaxID=3063330 RepID=A0ABT8YA12_9SPHN|nr:fatty acid--CoA ligase family protein [Sphingomonas sp. BIUV-7]MDO6415160.1 fatty acid--CoA ligase family protein [Sphingomonas sp. BIUV-7]